jgi:hypothetical protein
MTLAKASKASAETKHIYRTVINYDRHLQSSKYFWRQMIEKITQFLTK